VDAQVTREPVDRDLRRRQLAQRLVVHQARTRTIFLLTGLSRHQMATLRRRWRVTEDMRHRGPPPRSFAVFWSSMRMRAEGAALAVLWRAFYNMSGTFGETINQAAAVEFGERICDVFETFIACFPSAELELEHLVLLARALEQGDVIALSRCTSCEAAILIDLLGKRRPLCAYCLTTANAEATCSQKTGVHDEGEVSVDRTGDAVQQELF
jgi:hypothetical protein